MEVPADKPRVLGRYALHDAIASGGFAVVHLGHLIGAGGFSRTVAIKRLLPHLASEPEVVAMFLDEARLAARVKHPNVVPILDVEAQGSEVFLVMEYVQGESLARLLKLAKAARSNGSQEPPIPLPIVSAILSGALAGLHAAHEAKDEHGEPLELVHRDVSPQNVIVGDDGTARLLDFGIAKAVGRSQTTREGQLKGKLAYIAPEQILKKGVDRRADVYSSAVTLWQVLTGQRPFEGDEASLLYAVLHETPPPPSELSTGIPPSLDRVVERGLHKDPAARFATALEMAEALEAAVAPASARDVAEWVREIARESLEERGKLVRAIESAKAAPRAIEAAPSVVASAPVATALQGDSSELVTARAVPESPAPQGRSGSMVLAGAVVAAALAALVFAVTRSSSHAPEATPPAPTASIAAEAAQIPLATASIATAQSAPSASARAPASPPQATQRPRGAPSPAKTGATTATKPQRMPGEPDPGF